LLQAERTPSYTGVGNRRMLSKVARKGSMEGCIAGVSLI
jgi:hypothetical protein